MFKKLKIITFFQSFLKTIKIILKFFKEEYLVLKIVIKNFSSDNLVITASALTYFTILSIVPVLAMVFGIAKGFGLEEYLTNILKKNLSEHQAILQEVLNFVERLLGNIKGSYIAGAGFITLIWTVIKLIGNIEKAFNQIWNIKKSRTISRKLSDYIALVIISPVLLIISSSFTISQVSYLFENTFIISYIQPILRLVAWFMSFSLIWIVLTLLYIIIPNTKVNFVPAFIGGVISGTLFHILQWFYVKFQILLSNYGAIYGSFAALPLFMIWLQASWQLVLLGCKISFVQQNIKSIVTISDEENLSQYEKRILMVYIIHYLIKNFSIPDNSKTETEISEALGLPIYIVHNLIEELQKAGIITQTTLKNDKEFRYQIGIDPSILTFSYIFKTIECKNAILLKIKRNETIDKIQQIVDYTYEKNLTTEKLIKDIC